MDATRRIFRSFFSRTVFFWLIYRVCSAPISYPLPDKGMHPLQAHIYRPAHEEASWISTTLPTLKQPSSKVSKSLRLALFCFSWGPYAAIFFSKSLKRVFAFCWSLSSFSITISGSSLSEHVWEGLSSTMVYIWKVSKCSSASATSVFPIAAYLLVFCIESKFAFCRCDKLTTMNSCHFWSPLS